MSDVRVKRVYEDPAPPSDELRRWYGHDPDKAAEFERRYRAELEQPPRAELVEELAGLSADGPLTLLTATRDVARSNAAVLATHLRERTAGRGG